MKKILTIALATSSIAMLSAATLTVTSLADDDSEGTLRTVVAGAVDGDVVVFDDSLSGGTIEIVHRSHADWAIPVNASITIMGPEDKSIIIDGGYDGGIDSGSRIFAVNNAEVSLTCENLVLQNANGRDWGSSIYYGGAIYSEGDVFLENCTFASNRVAAITINGRKSIIGGAAAHVLGSLTVNNCEFIKNESFGSYMQGGLLTVTGENISIKNSKFLNNRATSHNAGIAVHDTVSNVVIENCEFNGNVAGANGCLGAIVHVVHNASADIFIKNSIFRNNGFSGSGAHGAVLYAEAGTCKFKFLNCEFSGNRSGGTTAGAVRLNSSSACVFVNCTVADNSASSHGGGLDLRCAAHLVNCTITGNFLTNPGDRTASAGIYHDNNTLKLLNTAVIHNFYTPNSEYVATQGNIYKAVSANDLAVRACLADGSVEPGETELFASYKMVDTIYKWWSEDTEICTYAAPVSVPALNTDEKRSRVVEIAKLGPLDGKGLLVKMTDDLSYIAYSADKGITWTTFYGEEDGSAKLLLQDQRGVSFSEKRVPIGAAAFDAPLATIILIL